MMTSYRKTEKCVLLLAINVHSFCKVFTVMKYALNLTERVNAVSFRPREVFKICNLDLNSTYDESFLNQFVLICIRNVWFFKVLLDVLHNHDELGNFPRHSKILHSRPRGSLKVEAWARLLAADRERRPNARVRDGNRRISYLPMLPHLDNWFNRHISVFTRNLGLRALIFLHLSINIRLEETRQRGLP